MGKICIAMSVTWIFFLTICASNFCNILSEISLSEKPSFEFRKIPLYIDLIWILDMCMLKQFYQSIFLMAYMVPTSTAIAEFMKILQTHKNILGSGKYLHVINIFRMFGLYRFFTTKLNVYFYRVLQ